MTWQRATTLWMVMLLVLATLTSGGCKKPKPAEKDYARPLPPGAFALRKITDPTRMPDLTLGAAAFGDPAFKEAMGRSLKWFAIPSIKQFFPSGPITHEQAWASVYAMSKVQSGTAAQVAEFLRNEFDVWESVGWDGSGTVLFTGYYTPVFKASRTATGAYQYPLYKRPSDLVTDSNTGAVLGKRGADGSVSTYPTRSEIERSGAMRGQELVYLPDQLDAYIIQVNGSARLEMTDGSIMYIGYAGNNGHDYTSIGKALAAEGKIDKNRISLAVIRSYFQAHPGELDGYIQRNARFVWFQEYRGDNWPAGSLGFKVTKERSLATDKAVFPRGLVTLVHTTGHNAQGASGPLYQYMVDQDTGGAIRAAGRADIYYGVGPRAEWFAGRQFAEGRLYYLILKPERV
jgi:membrane-bound lytic murein transglycosylase A